MTADDAAAPAVRSYSTRFVVDRSPEELFDSVLDVASWWTGEVVGSMHVVGDEFSYRHGPDHLSRQRVTELVPGRRVAWEVVESRLSFTDEPDEWTGSHITFDILPVGDGAELRFTHDGLVPALECYGACSAAWSHYVGASLHHLVDHGSGLPDPF